MPKRRKYDSVEAVDKDFKRECKNLKGDEMCLTPTQFVEDQLTCENGSVCKVDQRTLKQWLASKGVHRDSCFTT